MYCIKDSYKARENPVQYDDLGNRDEYQDEVYCGAALLARPGDVVLDVGCGSGFKLLKYFSGYETIGVDRAPIIDQLLRRHPSRKWSLNLCEADLVICSDVIEHLVDPDLMMLQLAAIKARAVVISTPERLRLAESGYCGADGPPRNPAHAREWTFAEFGSYCESIFGSRITLHEVIAQHTQVVVITADGKPL